MTEQPQASLDCLQDDMTGTFVVQTESGTLYLLNMDSRTLTRAPADEPAALRRDGEQVDLLQVEHCVVGHEALLFIDLHVPGVPFTLRITTPVISIRRAIDPISEHRQQAPTK